ncbi:MAG: hypothetical protein AAGD43_28210, partial [Pseudomonadota bacterium]
MAGDYATLVFLAVMCCRKASRFLEQLKAGVMAPPLLNLQNIQLTFGGTPLMTGADLQVGAGDRIGLVGR